jgi:hypothetical protein
VLELCRPSLAEPLVRSGENQRAAVVHGTRAASPRTLTRARART